MRRLKKIIYKFIICVLALSQLICVPVNSVYAYAEKGQYKAVRKMSDETSICDSEISKSENCLINEADEKKERKIETFIDSKKHRRGEHFKIDVIKNKDDKVTYTYDVKNINVVSTEDYDVELEVVSDNRNYGSIDIFAQYEDGEVIKKSVYTYTMDDEIYVNENSKDAALYDCMKEKYDAGLITEEEWEDEYFKYAQTLVRSYIISENESNENRGIALLSSRERTTIEGTLAWELEDGTILPLRQTRVQLMDKDPVGSEVIATTYTNNNGEFRFSFDNPDEWYELENGGIDAYIRFFADSETFGVNKDFGLLSYYAVSDVYENVSTGMTLIYNTVIEYDESSDAAKAFYVQQGMVVGQRFALEMGMKTNNYINVIYPFEISLTEKIDFNSEEAFCWGEIANNCFAAIGADVYNNIDVLIHEYGHFVEVSMGTYGLNLLEVLQYCLEHETSEDHFDKGYPKKIMMELVWSEAWAHAFSQLAQNYYVSDYKHIRGFADCKYDKYMFEKLKPGDKSGEAQEAMVVAFLWDLYDGAQSPNAVEEGHDNIALGYTNWWNYTTRPGTYTLDNFANNVDGYYYTYRSQIGKLMSAHQIAPSDVRILNPYNVSADVSPRITWKVNGSVSNPNNKFEIRIYDAYGNYICKTEAIYTSAANNQYITYVIPESVWKSVGTRFGGTFNVNIEIRGYNTKEIESGGYMSGYYQCSVKNNASSSIAASSRYVEKDLKLDKGGEFIYTVKFATAGNKLIQTFGNVDTVIEICSSGGIVLASNDDGGYGLNALMYFNFSANINYQIKVKFYSSSVTGTTKLAITPANGSFTSTTLSNYEGIFAITGKTSYSSVITTTANTTKVMTFTPPSSGTYTFEIQSGNDMYIYVIDPRSSAALTSASYNDDSGTNLNPLLAKSLTAGVPYLIICTPFNPSSLTSTIGFALKISKN